MAPNIENYTIKNKNHQTMYLLWLEYNKFKIQATALCRLDKVAEY
jgi:hypothetical protein